LTKEWIRAVSIDPGGEWYLTETERQRRLDHRNLLKDDKTYLGNLTLDEIEALGYTIHLYKTEAQDD